MLKIKGKEYPISKIEFYMHDEIIDRLEWIRDTLKLKKNLDALAITITATYNQLKQLEEFGENKLTAPLEDVKPDETSENTDL